MFCRNFNTKKSIFLKNFVHFIRNFSHNTSPTWITNLSRMLGYVFKYQEVKKAVEVWDNALKRSSYEHFKEHCILKNSLLSVVLVFYIKLF